MEMVMEWISAGTTECLPIIIWYVHDQVTQGLMTTQGQTVQHVQRLYIPIIVDNHPIDCTTFVWKS